MKIAGMKVELEDLLGCEMDLVEEGMLRPWAVESVKRDRKRIYERAFLSKTAPRSQDGA